MVDAWVDSVRGGRLSGRCARDSGDVRNRGPTISGCPAMSMGEPGRRDYRDRTTEKSMGTNKKKTAEAGLCLRKTGQACLRRRTMPMPASAPPSRIRVPGSGTLFRRTLSMSSCSPPDVNRMPMACPFQAPPATDRVKS